MAYEFANLHLAVLPVESNGSDMVHVLVPVEEIKERDITVEVGGILYAVLACSVLEFQHLSRLAQVHCGNIYSCPDWVGDVKRPSQGD